MSLFCIVFTLVISNGEIKAAEQQSLNPTVINSYEEFIDHIESDSYFFSYNGAGKPQEDIEEIYTIEVSEPGYIIISNYRSNYMFKEEAINSYLYKNKIMTNAVYLQSKYTPLSGDAYTSREDCSFYVTEGTYYLKLTGKDLNSYNSREYKQLSYASFFPVKSLGKVENITYNSDYTTATVYFKLIEDSTTALCKINGNIDLTEGVKFYNETNVIDVFDINDYSGNKDNEIKALEDLITSGWEINKSGLYTLCLRFQNSDYEILPAVITFSVDKIGFEKSEIEAKTIKISKTKATMKAGKSVTLTVTVKPKNVTDKTITWKSSNKKVATVDKNGKVTAKKKGTCTITAVTSNGKKAKCKITVKK